MIEKKMEKNKHEQKPRDDGVELENQFILRLPEEPSKILSDALQTGNLKDRMTIKLDSDLRYGEVRLDHWLLYAKVVDLPTIIECLKTIDNKSFYKSADICQIMICKEEPDDETEKESPNKGKKKDPNKVDKKYLWPHGITPPCKNVRKRRFRKTLKKKNVEAPEIEKEVKHLLRIDNEAVKVEYEIINEELDKSTLEQSCREQQTYDGRDESYNDDTHHGDGQTMHDTSSQRDINVESDEDEAPTFGTDAASLRGVAEHDIFGEELSSSDDDEDDNGKRQQRQMAELEEATRLSADDSRISDFFGASTSGAAAISNQGLNMDQQHQAPNEFNKNMFSDGIAGGSGSSPRSNFDKYGGSSSNLTAPSGFFEQHQSSQLSREELVEEFMQDVKPTQPQLTQLQINAKISQLRRQISDLKMQQTQKSQEIMSIQNATLKQRMQESLDNVLSQLVEKELELKDYENML